MKSGLEYYEKIRIIWCFVMLVYLVLIVREGGYAPSKNNIMIRQKSDYDCTIG